MYSFLKVTQFSSVQSLSCVWLFSTARTVACQASLFIYNSWSLLKLKSIESVMPSKHLILCHPLLLLPSIFPSIKVFSNESVLCIRWSKDWSFSLSISPFSEYSGRISFRMDWLDLLAVQGTCNSLLQHNSSKASILLHSAFFVVQVSHTYMTTGKTIAFTRQTFVSKAMALLFNMLSTLVIAFLPRSKHLLISHNANIYKKSILPHSVSIIISADALIPKTIFKIWSYTAHQGPGKDILSNVYKYPFINYHENLTDRSYYYLHFTNEKIETWKD